MTTREPNAIRTGAALERAGNRRCAEGGPSADKAYEALLVSARDFDLVLLDGSQVLPDQSWRRTLFIDDVVLVIHRNPARGAKVNNALEAARSASENVTGAVLVG